MEIKPALPQDLIALITAGGYPLSLAIQGETAFWMHRTPQGKRLGVAAPAGEGRLTRFKGEPQPYKPGLTWLLCPLSPDNARALREALPWLTPQPLGPGASFGFGDRLGLATPGHARALQAANQPGQAPSIAPIFCQQSIREMTRTGRSPQEVLDDATWGALQAGWQAPLGADADHLKTPADIDVCAAAGYTFFTFDPGEHVDSRADTATAAQLSEWYAELPWERLEYTPKDFLERYAQAEFDLGTGTVQLDWEAAARAAVKYGRAIAHIAMMYRHLAGLGVPFEVEISVDETETPTTHGEHVIIAKELDRLGVKWVSLAPRFVGRFEKGVDYLGDLGALQADLVGHARLAQALGGYKLSLHSGSDKFSVYPLLAEATGGQVHVKTAGTSYLEALRVVARVDPAFFREVLTFARERYEADRASYHVSASLERTPAADQLSDVDLPGLLEQFDAREVLHVTFGSVLGRWGDRLKATLRVHEADYDAGLQAHFGRHLAPFSRLSKMRIG